MLPVVNIKTCYSGLYSWNFRIFYCTRKTSEVLTKTTKLQRWSIRSFIWCSVDRVFLYSVQFLVCSSHQRVHSYNLSLFMYCICCLFCFFLLQKKKMIAEISHPYVLLLRTASIPATFITFYAFLLVTRNWTSMQSF